jgi:hypothetical protein
LKKEREDWDWRLLFRAQRILGFFCFDSVNNNTVLS